MSQQELKVYSKISFTAIVVQFVAAIVYYKERLLFADSSFIFFNIINREQIEILNQRYGSFITQVFPFIGSKLHLPLPVLLIGYALSFNLFVLVIMGLLVYRYKQYLMAILLGLYSFLFASASFFMLADTHIGVAWMFWALAVVIVLGNRRVNMLLLSIPFALLIYMAVTTHFVIIIPTVFLWVFLILQKTYWPFSRPRTIILSIILAIVIACKFLFINPNSYDGTHLNGITNFLFKDVMNVFSSPVLSIFYYRCLTNYWWAVIIFIVGIVYMVKSRKFLLLLWSVASVIGYFILVGITYANTDSNMLLCHIELEWICLGVVVGAPFVFCALPVMNKKIAAGILVLMFLTRMLYINNSMSTLTAREKYKKDIMVQMKRKGINKLALLEGNDVRSKCLLTWAIPYESLLYSAMNKDKPQLTFCFINRDEKNNIDILQTQNGFWDAYGIVAPKDINNKYFIVDTVQKNYQVMEISELFK